MNSIRLRLLATFALAVVAVAPGATAAPVLFSGFDANNGPLPNSTAAFNSFVAALNVVGTDTIEATVGTPPALTFGATGITATTSAGFVAAPPGLAVSPTKALVAIGGQLANGVLVNEVFTFNQVVNGFGSFFINVGDAAANTVTFRLENTVSATSVDVIAAAMPGGAAADNVFFAGVTDTAPFNRLTVIVTNAGDGILYDNVTAGVVVPEPSALVLALLGTMAVFFIARRRKKSWPSTS
ncbi:MAG: PEP-CTERM sorting domain-containing protein [Pirellulales bacterium]|nr:PEP-CTERM sorting domain-containing protein [Pirellulales bacterium]